MDAPAMGAARAAGEIATSSPFPTSARGPASAWVAVLRRWARVGAGNETRVVRAEVVSNRFPARDFAESPATVSQAELDRPGVGRIGRKHGRARDSALVGKPR